MVNRLKKVIGTLISIDQTTYVPGRFIGESVRLAFDLNEYTDIHNLHGYLVTIAIVKAFDSVDHKYLCAVLQKLGFGKNFIKWVKLILNKQESCVMNNSTSTGYFTLSSGTRQGDPISAYLFILVMKFFLLKFGVTITFKD